MLGQVEVSCNVRPKQAVDVAGPRVPESWVQLLRDGSSANGRTPLHHSNALSSACKVVRRDQAVVASSENDGVKCVCCSSCEGAAARPQPCRQGPCWHGGQSKTHPDPAPLREQNASTDATLDRRNLRSKQRDMHALTNQAGGLFALNVPVITAATWSHPDPCNPGRIFFSKMEQSNGLARRVTDSVYHNSSSPAAGATVTIVDGTRHRESPERLRLSPS